MNTDAFRKTQAAFDANDPAWEATRAQAIPPTQILEDDEPNHTGFRDVGRSVGNDQRELFVSCGPAEALLQQFEVLQPDFVAIHDVGCTISRRLLAGVAHASRRQVQTLTIRRQGYGTALATLEYIEWATQGSRVIRLYTTEVDADGASRQAIAQVLLAHSRLAVVVVGDLPAHVIATSLQPIQLAMRAQPWPNREMLMLPLNSATVLATQANQLAQGSGVAVRTTPKVARPAEAWSYLSGAWNRWREQLGPSGQSLPTLPSVSAPRPATASTDAAAPAPAPAAAARPAAYRPAPPPSAPHAPLPMRPMPSVPRGAPREHSLDDVLSDYVNRLFKLNGMQSVCVFDRETGQAHAHAGTYFGANALASQGHALMRGCLGVGDSLAMPLSGPEVALTLDAHHIVLHPLPRHPELMLLAVLDKSVANLTLARLQILRLDEDFTN